MPLKEFNIFKQPKMIEYLEKKKVTLPKHVLSTIENYNFAANEFNDYEKHVKGRKPSKEYIERETEIYDRVHDYSSKLYEIFKPMLTKNGITEGQFFVKYLGFDESILEFQ